MQAALRAVGVPSTVQSGDSVFLSKEAEELEHVMMAVLEPSRSGTVRVSLITALFGQDIEALSNSSRMPLPGISGWSAFVIGRSGGRKRVRNLCPKFDHNAAACTQWDDAEHP